MPLITKSHLRTRAAFYRRNMGEETKSYKRMMEERMMPAPLDKEYTIFLSHSFLDVQEVLGLTIEFQNSGHTTYVDWVEDSYLNRANVTRKTADLLRIRMQHCKCLLFATSSHSSSSKWMPWEAGYFDGINGKVAIIPIVNTPVSNDAYRGQEYLSLYPYVSLNWTNGSLQQRMFVNEDEDTYVSFSSWLDGEKPYEH